MENSDLNIKLFLLSCSLLKNYIKHFCLVDEPEIVWKFNETTINNWTVSCDSDHGEGLSSGKLSVSTLGHGMFSGVLNTHLPKDGKMKRTGYCNLRSHRHTVGIFVFFLSCFLLFLSPFK